MGPSRGASRLQRLLGSGLAWSRFWTTMAVGHALLIIPGETIWAHSIRFLNAISVDALVLGCLAAFQASLGMRKIDPRDPL